MKNPFENLVLEINHKLQKLLSKKKTSYAVLFEAAHYSLFSGKRMRPLLSILCAELFDVKQSDILEPACCIELIHSYSLIHDDLPSMDNDDIRHGKPTLHKAYSEGTAILTGDFLLTYAFEILSKCDNLEDSKKILLIQSLSKRAGAHGMIGGQVMDLDFESTKPKISVVEKMYLLKTASLFIASVEFAAIIGEASEKETSLLKKFAEKMGIAFQIQNDINSWQSLGNKSSDFVKQKAAISSLLEMNETQKLKKKLFTEAKKLFSQIDKPKKNMESFLEYMEKNIFRDEVYL